MRVRFSKAAAADLSAIETYIAADSSARAATFALELARSCNAIGGMPLVYPIVSGKRLAGLRRKAYKGYVIFYVADANTVEIVRILHGSRDIGRILRTGEP